MAAVLVSGGTLVSVSGAADATRTELEGVDTNITVGTPDTVRVRMFDASNAAATTYAGTVTFSASCGDCFTITPNNGGANTKSFTFTGTEGGFKDFQLVWT
ncbi:MAG: hypothetical protein M3179_01200, partial [Actinomycetota bacterium]|nr:hypothetical protein [Actinomycetota bacterium]